MKIKEFIQNGGKIISNATQALFNDFITADAQSTINNNFKYQYFNRDMVEDTQEDIDALVQYILLKNKIEYGKLYESLTAVINPNKVTQKETNSGKDTKDNSGTQDNDVTFGKVVTHKPAETTTTRTPADFTVTTTPAETTTTTTPAETTETTTPATGTVTTTPYGDTTTENGTVTTQDVKSTKPFDSTEFTETEKDVQTVTPNQKSTVVTHQGTEQVTNTNTTPQTIKTEVDNNEVVKVEVDTAQTVKNETDEPETIKVEVDTNETTTDSGTEKAKRTDNLKEEFTHGHIKDLEIVNPNEIIDNYEKLRAFYSLHLWDRITKDILHFVCLDVWSTSYYDL